MKSNVRTLHGKQCGKTRSIIRESARGFIYIVCPTQQRCDQVKRLATEMRLDIPLPISFSEYLKIRGNSSIRARGVLIDDFDLCILNMLPHDVPVHAVSITDLFNYEDIPLNCFTYDD